MKDGIIKGDGTSRLMRATLPATYEEFKQACEAGTQPLDVLFNALGWSTLPDFLNKGNLLKDATAALYGLGTDAVPDDVLALLSRFNSGLGNEYLWEKTEEIFVAYPSPFSNSTLSLASSYPYTVYYSTEINPDTGEVHLSGDVKSISIASAEQLSDLNFLVGSEYYFEAPLSGIVKVSSGTIEAVFSSSSVYNAYGERFSSVKELKTAGYTNSSSPDAYPPPEPDGYTYTALGQLGNKVRIETGSYTGTGTYGASNPNSLTFGFMPKIVVVGRTDSSDTSIGFICGRGNATTTIPSTIRLTWGQNFVSWYAVTNNATYQLNAFGATYNYIAIG